MNLRLLSLAVLAVIFLSAAHPYAEPVPDRLIGKVSIRNSAKLDAQAKKEISAIAAKIKKVRANGTVKIVGDVPSAESQDEYISKAVFMAHNVESQIKKLLSARYQVYVTASRYSGEKRAGSNSVEIHLYPYELKAEGAGFISSQVTSEEQPRERESLPAISSPEPPSDSGLLSSPAADYERVEVTSRKEKRVTETEDPALANDLVNRAKARAAEKAKRLQREQ